MHFGGVKAQQITIKVLAMLSTVERRELSYRLESLKGNISNDVFLQFYRCKRISLELIENAEKYSTISSVLCTIIARQSGRKPQDVLKRECMQKLGLKHNEQLCRIEHGEVLLTESQIINFCAAFKKEADQRFWKNQILSFYPEIRIPVKNTSEPVEELCLKIIVNALTKEMLCKVKLALQEYLLFENCPKEFFCPEQDLCDGRLYGYIDQIYRQANKKRYSAEKESYPQNLDSVRETLMITTNTWYSWKKQWEEAESKEFKNGVPKRRLSIEHLYIIAVILDMNYWQTIYLFSLAGARTKNGEPDQTVLRYLLYKDTGKDRIIAILQSTITNS